MTNEFSSFALARRITTAVHRWCWSLPVHKPKYQTGQFQESQAIGSGQVKHQELGRTNPCGVIRPQWVKDKKVSWLSIIFNMGIPIPGKTVFILKQGPGGQICVSVFYHQSYEYFWLSPLKQHYYSLYRILATPWVQDSPIWIQPRGVFRINPTPGSWMSKNYTIISQFVIALMAFYRSGVQKSDVNKRVVFVMSWRSHNYAWQPQRHDHLSETSGTL